MQRNLSLILSLLALLLVSCSRASYPRVSLAESDAPAPTANANAPRKLPLRLAVATVISPQATLEAYGPLLDYLSLKLERPVNLIQRNTYAEINELIRSGGADLAFVCGGAYVEGQREFGMELLVAPEVRGETVYYSYIIVPSDSPAQRFADLRGLTFGFTDPFYRALVELTLEFVQSEIGEVAQVADLHPAGEVHAFLCD